LAIFSSVIHIGSNPPLIGFVLRPTTVKRHTYNNIVAKGFYTINALPISKKEDGHLTSAKYSKEESEFDKTGFTAGFGHFDVPYVRESPIALTCELRSDQLLEVNQTRLIIGEIKEVKLNPKYIAEDGFYDLVKSGITTISGMDSYHEVESGNRFEYARPNQEIISLPQ
jgi:flavin reductase (DIM6/NTAB) family NADH-FMN oxidoreductase RutF